MAQRAIADDYQRLIWGPAEILNGRMASECPSVPVILTARHLSLLSSCLLQTYNI